MVWVLQKDQPVKGTNLVWDIPRETATNQDPEMENQHKSSPDFQPLQMHELSITLEAYHSTYKFVNLFKLPIEDGRGPVRPLL